jgi:hypothetical protein
MSRVTNLTAIRPSESSAYLIQHSIESSLVMLKEEKKEEILLNNEIKLLEQKIAEQKLKKRNFQETEHLKKTYNSLIKQVETSCNQIDSIQSENRTLKEKIEDLRLETNKYKRIIEGLQQDLSYSSTLAQTRSQSTLKQINTEDITKQKIYKVLNKSSGEKISLIQKINSLTSVIKQDKQEQFLSLKKHSDLMQLQINRQLTVLDIEKLVFSINAAKTHSVNSIQKLLSAYKSRQKKLKDGFSVLSHISGLSNPLEIADFIIGSEKNRDKLNYHLLSLNSDIESLNFTNTKTLAAASSRKEGSLLSNSIKLKKKISNELKKCRDSFNDYAYKTLLMMNDMIKAEQFIDVIFI